MGADACPVPEGQVSQISQHLYVLMQQQEKTSHTPNVRNEIAFNYFKRLHFDAV